MIDLDLEAPLGDLRIALMEVDTLAAMTKVTYDEADWMDPDSRVVEAIAALLGLIDKSACAAMGAYDRLQRLVSDAAPVSMSALFDGAAVTHFDGSGAPQGRTGMGKRESARDHVAGRVLADAAGGDEIGGRRGQGGVPDPAELPDRGGGQRRGSRGELGFDLRRDRDQERPATPRQGCPCSPAPESERRIEGMSAEDAAIVRRIRTQCPDRRFDGGTDAELLDLFKRNKRTLERSDDDVVAAMTRPR